MDKLLHSLDDFPDDPNHMDWDKEAFLFYTYMLDYEEQIEKKIRKIIEDFKKKIEKESDPVKRKSLYENLKIEIYRLRDNFLNDDFNRALAFLLLVSPVLSELEKTIETSISRDAQIRSILDIYKEQIEPSLKETVEELQDKALTQAYNKLVRIVRTESWRNVNESRLKEFTDKGYKYKTTYPVKDDRTGKDSWYYYDMHQVKPIDEPFEYVWEGQTRTFMTPPDRPNDRNILVPYLGEL
jgi:hypothetical protein